MTYFKPSFHLFLKEKKEKIQTITCYLTWGLWGGACLTSRVVSTLLCVSWDGRSVSPAAAPPVWAILTGDTWGGPLAARMVKLPAGFDTAEEGAGAEAVRPVFFSMLLARLLTEGRATIVSSSRWCCLWSLVVGSVPAVPLDFCRLACLHGPASTGVSPVLMSSPDKFSFVCCCWLLSWILVVFMLNTIDISLRFFSAAVLAAWDASEIRSRIMHFRGCCIHRWSNPIIFLRFSKHTYHYILQNKNRYIMWGQILDVYSTSVMTYRLGTANSVKSSIGKFLFRIKRNSNCTADT